MRDVAKGLYRPYLVFVIDEVGVFLTLMMMTMALLEQNGYVPIHQNRWFSCLGPPLAVGSTCLTYHSTPRFKFLLLIFFFQYN